MGNFISDLFVDADQDAGCMPANGYGFFQLLFHGLVYGYILFQSSNMISEGSELLLLTPYKNVVGSVVLPILGAVPDGAIILFSGADQLAVGVGALAGSTIMLLTIPWCLAMVAGRVDMHAPAGSEGIQDAGHGGGRKIPSYSGRPENRLTLDQPIAKQLFNTGVSVDASIKRAGLMMLLTSISYIIIQGPSFGLSCQHTDCNCADGDLECIRSKAHDEKPWAWAGFGVAVTLFFVYVFDQFRQSAEDNANTDRKAEEVGKNALKRGINLSFSVFLNAHTHRGLCGGTDDVELEALTDGNEQAQKNFERVIEKIFNKYNTIRGGIDGEPEIIDGMEVGKLLTDMHMSGSYLWEKLKTDAENRQLTLERFKATCWEYVNEQSSPAAASINMERKQSMVSMRKQMQEAREEEDCDEDEEFEVPEGMEGLDLSEAAQQREIWKRSLTQMLTGTTIVLFISDPMCDILSSLGDRIHVSAFYVSFVLAPLASNASELLAAYNYALKKTKKTMTISVSTLLGAACMNNSFCLAIFLLKICQADDQVWEYAGETLAILAVEYVMLFFAFQQHLPLYYAIFIIAIFPLSIGLVILLKAVGLD
ncbi:hypothetical protein DIPPA_34516 [Diplonema papillatum]|nr:hypothetical protein DIPPA_34516 [Diplonema papillatum]